MIVSNHDQIATDFLQSWALFMNYKYLSCDNHGPFLSVPHDLTDCVWFHSIVSCADRCQADSLGQADSQLHPTSPHISLPTNPPFPPQHPHSSSFQQRSTSSCALKRASCYGNPIQQHIILLSELKRGSISDDVTASREALKSWSQSHQNCLVRACVYIHRYIRVWYV